MATRKSHSKKASKKGGRKKAHKKTHAKKAHKKTHAKKGHKPKARRHRKPKFHAHTLGKKGAWKGVSRGSYKSALKKLATAERKLEQAEAQLEKSTRRPRRKKGVRRHMTGKGIAKMRRKIKGSHPGRRGHENVTADQILGAVSKPHVRKHLVKWACVGPRKTGCGGGVKGRLGSQVMKGAVIVSRQTARRLGLKK